jgi:ATP-dependent Clp protease ATP-binding subunit ClpB
MNPNEMTIKLQEALQAASGLAMRRNHQGIDVEHLLAALLEQADGSTIPILEQAGVSPKSVSNAVEQALKKIPQVQVSGLESGRSGDERASR